MQVAQWYWGNTDDTKEVKETAEATPILIAVGKTPPPRRHSHAAWYHEMALVMLVTLSSSLIGTD